MRLRYASTLLCLSLAFGCGSKSTPSITLATTTSVQDTGLLDRLVPLFQEQTGIEVKVVPVGTGQALQLGRRGDADVLIVHDPDSEQQFMNEGHGEFQRKIMHNDFIIVGPPNDPAGLRDPKFHLPFEAFRRIEEMEAAFVSRGDESGTHQREKFLWAVADVSPDGKWYVKGGGGMAATLRIANEKRAYTLTDRGTYLTQRDKLELVVVQEGGPHLNNDYSVIVVNRDKHSPAKDEWARRFAEFLIAPETQKVIGEFGVERFGQPLFVPDASEPK